MAKDRLVMQAPEKTAFGDQLPPKQVSWRAQMPRYVVEVDGQAKSGFDNRTEAETEAKRISDAFPKLQVKVADWQSDTVTTLGKTTAPAEIDSD